LGCSLGSTSACCVYELQGAPFSQLPSFRLSACSSTFSANCCTECLPTTRVQRWYVSSQCKCIGLTGASHSVSLQYAGYQNNGTTFSAGLKANLDYVDQSFARILAALNTSGNAASTGLVITAKHGQQPITTNATLISPTPISTALAKQNIRYACNITHATLHMQHYT